jgi:hypothetical protein
MSIEGGRRPYQLHLGEKTPETLWFFEEGTMIWPERSRRGVLRNGVYARKLEGEKITGLTAFQAQNRLNLYFDGKYWSLPEGTIFGAYAKNAKRGKIK